jgi:N-acetylglucosamine kinase-like BadF-type ATPase
VIPQKAAIGIAGFDTPQDRQVLETFIMEHHKTSLMFGAAELVVVSDALVGLYSGTDTDNGVCIIAGTGANIYGIRQDGREARAGDWGFILGDQSSGFAMGLALLRLVMREFDGRIPKSVLTDKVLAYLKLSDPLEMVKWIYAGRVPVDAIAQVSRLCVDPEIRELPEVLNLIDESAREAGLAYKAVVDRLELTLLERFPVVLVGGMMMHQDYFRNQVIDEVMKYTLQAEVTLPQRPPAEGAAYMIQSQYFGGVPPASAIRIVRES